MGKATTLPDGVKKSQVVLTTYDEDTDTTKVVTRDGKHWFSKYGSNWSEEDPEDTEGRTPKYDPAQEEFVDPEAEETEEETEEDEEEEETPPPKTDAELKAEAAKSKAAKARTVAAQKIAANEGSSEASKQNSLLNRQARLAGEGVTSSHPVDSGPGGSGGIRTLTEREIEILEGSEANIQGRKDKIAARPGIDNTLPEEPLPGKPPEPPLGGAMAVAEKDEEINTLKAEVGKLKEELRAKNVMVAKYQVAMAGKGEGVPVDESSPVFLAPQPMAGVYPHNTDEMPTVDEINARNGQPERSPRPALRGSKERDERGYPIVPPERPTDQ